MRARPPKRGTKEKATPSRMKQVLRDTACRLPLSQMLSVFYHAAVRFGNGFRGICDFSVFCTKETKRARKNRRNVHRDAQRRFCACRRKRLISGGGKGVFGRIWALAGFFAKKVVTNTVFLGKMTVYFQRTNDG